MYLTDNSTAALIAASLTCGRTEIVNAYKALKIISGHSRHHISVSYYYLGKYSEIDKKFYIGSTYMSLEGENLICRQYYYPEYIRGILSAIKIEELYDKDKMAMLIAKEKFINSLSDEQKKLYDEYCSKRIDFYITASGLHKEESFINL